MTFICLVHFFRYLSLSLSLSSHVYSQVRNSIETFVYDVRSKLEEDEDLQKYTTAEEKEKILEVLEETGGWLYEEGSTASLVALKSKDKYLHSLADPLFARRSEHEGRDHAVRLFLAHILYAKNQTANITHTHEVEEDEYAKFLDFLAKEEDTIVSLYRQQQDRPLHLNPLFTAHDLDVKQKDFEKRVKAFRLRPEGSRRW